MYRGKRVMKITKMSKRAALLVLSLVTILSISVGGTLAYLIQQTEDVTNVFQPGTVTTTTEEKFDGNEKSNVKISAAGSNIDTCVRAKIVVEWIAEDDSIWGQTPVEGTDYTISIDETGWVKGNDGFWYCRDVVKAGQESPVLITKCAPVPTMGPVGGHLRVTILSQAIQATPKALQAAGWKVIPKSVSGTN